MADEVGHRLRWADVPAAVQKSIEAELGSAVVAAEGQRGGYGPGLAARCRLADGRGVFVKAVSPEQNPDSPVMMRREGVTAGTLDADIPAPRLLHVVDDGTWVALVFEEVDGRHPTQPWVGDDLRQVLRASVALGAGPAPPHLPTVVEQFGSMLRGWRTLSDEGGGGVSDEWCRRNLDRLVAIEARWEEAAVGDQLIHGDVRSDNVFLVDGPPGVVFVDWASTCVGVEWFDVVNLAPSVELEGGGTPDETLALAGLAIDRDALVPMVAAMAGYFVERGRLADPPGLPTVRAFQRAQGEVTIAWLRRLLR